MYFGVSYLVCYLSQFLTLMPGDVIATGTSPGVGLGCDPPRFLEPGDVMCLGIDCPDEQRLRVMGWSERD